MPLVAAPAHAIFVHFTVALTAASFAFDAGALVFGVASLGAAGWWSLLAATAATVLTVVTGIISRLRLPVQEGDARRFLRAHMTLGPIIFGLQLALSVRRGTLWQQHITPSWDYLAAAAVVVLLITLQGFLGGELVYRWGAEVRGRYAPLPTEPPPRSDLL